VCKPITYQNYTLLKRKIQLLDTCKFHVSNAASHILPLQQKMIQLYINTFTKKNINISEKNLKIFFVKIKLGGGFPGKVQRKPLEFPNQSMSPTVKNT